MTYKTDKLKQYQTLKVKREDRFKSLGDEISKAENIIFDKQQDYTEALRNDDDKKAAKLLDEISKLSNEIKLKNDKARMLNTGEEEIRKERGLAALDEYEDNKKVFEDMRDKAESELAELRSAYISKAHSIFDMSREFQQVHNNYQNIPNAIGDKQRKVTMIKNYIVSPNKYIIKNMVNGGNK